MKKNLDVRVEWILKNYPTARDSDHDLLLTFWDYQGLKLTPEQRQIFMRCDIAESITRARRKLRVKYPGTPKVELERRNKQEQYRERYARALTL